MCDCFLLPHHMGIHMLSSEVCGCLCGGVIIKGERKKKNGKKGAIDIIDTINSHPVECILLRANCIHRATHEIFS